MICVSYKFSTHWPLDQCILNAALSVEGYVCVCVPFHFLEVFIRRVEVPGGQGCLCATRHQCHVFIVVVLYFVLGVIILIL